MKKYLAAILLCVSPLVQADQNACAALADFGKEVMATRHEITREQNIQMVRSFHYPPQTQVQLERVVVIAYQHPKDPMEYALDVYQQCLSIFDKIRHRQ